MTKRALDWPAILGLLLLAAFTAAVLAAAMSAPPAQARDKNCSDFNNQRQAQRWFHRHHPHQDPANLDSDNDGRACEDNPCPCSQHRWKHGMLATVRVPVRHSVRLVGATAT